MRSHRPVDTFRYRDAALWGYVYENSSYPANMQPLPYTESDFARVGVELTHLAGPSKELQARVDCIAATCARSNTSRLLDNACQCGTWQLACALSNGTSPAPMSNFCRLLSNELSPCALVAPELLHATSAVMGLPTLNACFPDSCNSWGLPTRGRCSGFPA